jgi:hypothetical protein
VSSRGFQLVICIHISNMLLFNVRVTIQVKKDFPVHKWNSINVSLLFFKSRFDITYRDLYYQKKKSWSVPTVACSPSQASALNLCYLLSDSLAWNFSPVSLLFTVPLSSTPLTSRLEQIKVWSGLESNMT